MNENIIKGNDFIGYEYKDIAVKRDSEALYADSYTSFGWILEGTAMALGGINSLIMKFKRDRKISYRSCRMGIFAGSGSARYSW